MKRTRTRLALLGAVTLATATAVVTATYGPAAAHGGLTFPATRTYACYVDAISNGVGGGLNPQNEMCKQLLAENGNYPFYNWFGNLLSQAGGRHREVVPDGKLCGPGPQFSGVNAVGDWPTTQVSPGQRITFQYNAWAKHPGRFDQYITKDGWDPSKPLTWDDLEPTPFDSVVNPPVRSGGPQGDEYYWNATLPDKQGQHIIYSVWTRSDSPEAFYNCSDVNFGGDDGPHVPPITDTEAPTAPGTPTASGITATAATLTWAAATDDVGVRAYVVQNAATGATLATTETTTATLSGLTPDTSYTVRVVARDQAGNVSSPSASVTFRTAAQSSTDSACSVDYDIASAWPGGFVANITVHNDSMTPINGWRLAWTFSNGEGVSSAWGGDAAQSGSNVTIVNAPWAATIGHHGSVSLGFVGSAPNGAPQVPASFTLNGVVCD